MSTQLVLDGCVVRDTLSTPHCLGMLLLLFIPSAMLGSVAIRKQHVPRSAVSSLQPQALAPPGE